VGRDPGYPVLDVIGVFQLVQRAKNLHEGLLDDVVRLGVVA